MNVLSLFDGISGAQVALERAGIPVDNYFASEVDKYAIKITQKNYPDTIQLGDVRDIKAADLPKIDLLIGGSPCVGFSYAGKGLNFKDPQSKLFFEFVRLLKEINPKYFLLENVAMKAEYVAVISNLLGVWPIAINSSLVSAQNRNRLYWTNIKAEQFTLFGDLKSTIKQPKDKKILLKDIIESGVVDREKSYCIDANYYKKGNITQYFEKKRRQLVFSDDKKTEQFFKKAIGTLAYKKATSQLKGLRSKANCLTASGQNISNSGSTNLIYKTCGLIKIRPLTPRECERLQTFEDNYTDVVSNHQRYKALGNSFTVDVIAHILGHMKGCEK